MDGRTDRLRHLLGSLESVVGTIDAQKAQIIPALESMNGLAETLNAERETIGEALDAMGPAVEVLAAQHDELIEMLAPSTGSAWSAPGSSAPARTTLSRPWPTCGRC